MAIRTEERDYPMGDVTAEAYVAYDDASSARRPAVLVIHAWAGTGDSERRRTEQIAGLGYIGFAIDAYGKGIRGGVLGDGGPASNAFNASLENRGLLRQRLLAGVEAARQHPLVDPARLAAIGYCFGGLAALDLARANAPGVRGVVSFHGIFPPPNLGPQAPIAAKVLILHGYDDPLATPDAMLGVARELTEAGADWQIHAYGHTVHGFTLEHANAPDRGLLYSAAADRRSWQAMQNFLAEVLG